VNSLVESAYRLHYRQLYRFLRRRTRNRQHAEDLAQTVFAEAVASLDQPGHDGRSVLPWLYAVAQRRLADEARRVSRRGPHLPLEAAAGEVAGGVEYGRGVAAALRVALADLPEGQRRVVVLKLLEGQSFAEIADSVGASEDACKMRFSRALAQVRERLAQEGIEP
jgi:RNA polymerase sigma factor (sigma-70 family)